MNNYNKVITMKTAYVITVIGCVLILAAGLIAGCTSTAPAAGTTAVATHATSSITSVPTPVSTSLAGTVTPAVSGTTPTLFVNSTANGDIVTIPMGTRVLVRLKENPTTGYTWNATATKGLAIISDTYTSPADTSLMGAPGYHEWILSPKYVDTYIFKTVSLRPWEGATATDESFSLVIQVTKD